RAGAVAAEVDVTAVVGPDGVPVGGGVAGDRDGLASRGGNGEDVALAAVADDAPEGDAIAAGGPARLHGVGVEELAGGSGGGVDDVQRAEAQAGVAADDALGGADDGGAGGGPGGVGAEVGEAARGLAGGAHDEGAAAGALGAEGDAVAGGGEGGLGVVGLGIGCEVGREVPADALPVNVEVARGVG